MTQAKAATKQASEPSETAADAAVSAAPATAAAPELAQASAQPGLADPDESATAEPKQTKAEKSTKKSKRKAEAATVGAEPGTGSGALETQPKAGKKKKTKVGAQQGSVANGHLAEAPESASPAVEDSTGPHANGSSEPQPLKLMKEKQQQAAEAAVPEAGDAPSAADTPGEKGPSWAKLAKEILAGCEGHKMKLAKLQRKVVAAAGLPKQAVADHQGAIMQKLSSKRKSFRLTEGEVLLKVV